MNTFKTRGKGSSKKRPFFQAKSKASNSVKTLIVTHQDGSVTKTTPNPEFFDGDFKTLAISLARKGERVVWRIV